jgi:hypothetical protein
MKVDMRTAEVKNLRNTDVLATQKSIRKGKDYGRRYIIEADDVYTLVDRIKYALGVEVCELQDYTSPARGYVEVACIHTMLYNEGSEEVFKVLFKINGVKKPR